MISRAFAIVLLLGGSALAADLAGLQRLLEQAGAPGQTEDTARMAAFQAKRELLRQLCQTDDALRNAFAPRLVTGLSDPRPEMRIAAAQALTVKPKEENVDCVLFALQTDSNPAVRWTFVRCVMRSISGLPEPARGAVVTTAIEVFEDIVREPATKLELRRLLVVSLGGLGPAALPAIGALQGDRRWGSILHSELPAALGATGDPGACVDIVALYESDSSVGFRAGCIQAIGELLRRASAADLPALGPATDLLRSNILQRPDPRLAASAVTAYSQCPGARTDGQIVGAICSRLQDASGDERKAYLRALLALDLPLGPETRTFLEIIRDSETAPVIHRKVAAAILTAHE